MVTMDENDMITISTLVRIYYIGGMIYDEINVKIFLIFFLDNRNVEILGYLCDIR